VEDPRIELFGLARDELSAILQSDFAQTKYRADQIISWVYRHGARDFSVMSNVAKAARDLLSESFALTMPRIVSTQESKDGSCKYLLELSDGARVESVLIKQESRYTLCISSQVGCAMGCTFCMTAQMGFGRNLGTHEIIGQVLAVNDAAFGSNTSLDEQPRLRNVVFMGMGEPLHNLSSVLKALKILNDPLGFEFGSRKITVSTSGMVPEIKKFADARPPARLAVSLNATTDEVRTSIMPINKRWNIDALMESLRYYSRVTDQEVTIEYVLLAGVNDSQADLKRLPKLLKNMQVKVNLIPYNANTGLGYTSSKRDLVERWQRDLNSQGVNTRIRWSKGEDIGAACGQLAVGSGK